MPQGHQFLVLGGAGNVGQWAVHELARRFPESTVRASYRTHGISKPPDHWKALRNVEPVEVDLDDPKSIDRAMKGTDRVFFVPQNTPKQLEHDRNILRAIRSSDTVEFYVRQSAYRAICVPGSACNFLAMHAEAEAALADSGVKHAGVRPNCGFANIFFLVLPSLPYGGVRWPWPPDLRLAHVDPRDVGAIAALLLATRDIDQRNGTQVRVMGPAQDTARGIVDLVASKCRVEASYTQIPYEEFKQSLIQGANMSEWMADGAAEVLRAMEDACTTGELYVDDTGADGVMPFESSVGRPKHSFRDFVDFFSIPAAYERMRQHSNENPNY